MVTATLDTNQANSQFIIYSELGMEKELCLGLPWNFT